MAGKSGKAGKSGPPKIVVIRAVFIPANHGKRHDPISVTDTEGRAHRIRPSASLADDVRDFAAGRAFRVSGNGWTPISANGAPPAKAAVAEASQQSLFKEAER